MAINRKRNTVMKVRWSGTRNHVGMHKRYLYDPVLLYNVSASQLEFAVQRASHTKSNVNNLNVWILN